MFENVSYTYYHDTMGRSVVPDQASFARWEPEAKAYMIKLLPFLIEREPGGIDKATCMVVEEYYLAAASGCPDGGRIASESIDSYSRSFDVSEAKTSGSKKAFWIEAYCLRKELK